MSPAPAPSSPASPAPGLPHLQRNLRWLVRAWFGFSEPVGQTLYMRSGFALMLLKYTLDALAIYVVTGRVWRGVDYLSPFFFTRGETGGHHPVLLSWLVVTTLPFAWIGASMSVRRARDAGLKATTGLCFFLPFINYLFMLMLCVLPSRAVTPRTPGPPVLDSRLVSALLGVAVGTVTALGMVGFSVFVVEKYAAALFVGTPFLMGCASGYLYNRNQSQSLRATLSVAVLTVSVGGGALLLFALEGAMCLAMAYPLALVTSALGAILGRMVAIQSNVHMAPLAALVLALPFLSGAELTTLPGQPRQVTSQQIINAPPQRVWPNVVGFSELPPPAEWFFRLGIAHPVRARIDGAGVGAVRYCEFSTGAFVEPITHWEPPVRLGFDVTSQPPPMRELSPYAVVHAPHLDGFLLSRRGEFRLSALPGNRTLLEGSTWYDVAIFPHAYWTPWADALIHAIHERVLLHVQTLSETPALPPG